MEIKSNLFPYRLILSRRKPVELAVEVKNNSEERKLASLELALTRFMAFDRGGLKTEEVKRLGELLPGETRSFYFSIYPKQGISPAEYPVQIRVLEHYNNYKYMVRQVTKNLSLIVEP